MYKANFPSYGSGSIIIEIRSREQYKQHFKVIGHWKKDLSDKDDVINTSKSQAHTICTLMNAGHTDFSLVLKELEKQNTALKERVEIIADVNWRTAFGWKIVAFILGSIVGVSAVVYTNHFIH